MFLWLTTAQQELLAFKPKSLVIDSSLLCVIQDGLALLVEPNPIPSIIPYSNKDTNSIISLFGTDITKFIFEKVDFQIDTSKDDHYSESQIERVEGC